MLPARDPPAAPRGRDLLGRRTIAVGLALLLEALLVLALLGIGSRQMASPPGVAPKVFRLFPEGSAHRKVAASRSNKNERESATAPRKPVVTAAKSPLPSPNKLVIMSKKEFAASDIGALPHSGSGTGSGLQAGSTYGPGEGPGGAQLFNAEWFREPTHGELAPYLPPNASEPGWAMIVCRTIDHYHVENCQALGESPLGSGLARALRLAAWQFLVRPPRANGKPIIGAWVRIRFDWTVTKAGGTLP